MRKLLSLLAPVVVLAGGLFNSGCTASQRQALYDEVEATVKEKMAEALPKLQEAALAKAAELGEKKGKELVEKGLLAYDLTLAKFKSTTVDADGISTETVKTWKDFDDDKNNELSAGEIAKLNLYIGQQTALRVTRGEMSKTDAVKTAKDSGSAALLLGAGMLLLKGAKKLKPGAKPAPSPSPSPGPAASPSSPAPPV